MAPPAGQAPLWVREAWVGLTLPTEDREPLTYSVTGVLDTKGGLLGWLKRFLPGASFPVHGFEVPSAKAIALLEETAPDAAAWWWDNTPDFLRPEANFLFEEDVCRWRSSP